MNLQTVGALKIAHIYPAFSLLSFEEGDRGAGAWERRGQEVYGRQE